MLKLSAQALHVQKHIMEVTHFVLNVHNLIVKSSPAFSNVKKHNMKFSHFFAHVQTHIMKSLHLLYHSEAISYIITVFLKMCQ